MGRILESKSCYCFEPLPQTVDAPRLLELQKLMKSLGHEFSVPSLLHVALSHKSYSRRYNYERLELLGDSVLGLCVAQRLLTQSADEAEGNISVQRSLLVNGKALAEVATKLELEKYFLTGVHTHNAKNCQSLLEDIFEAVCGAIFLDAGFDVAYHFVGRVLDFNSLHDARTQDAKTALQELMQANSLDLPVYEVVEKRGKPPHEVFRVSCSLSWISSQAMGSSRKEAEQKAAESIFLCIKDSLAQNRKLPLEVIPCKLEVWFE